MLSFRFLILLVAISSCTLGPPPFAVAVDALVSRSVGNQRSYILLPGNDGVTWDDLQFQEFANYLDRALLANKFVAAASPQDAELAIVLSYGMDAPVTTRESYTTAIWGQTGFHRIYVPSHHAGGEHYRNDSCFYFTPIYGVTGYRQGQRSVTTFLQHAMIVAYDPKDLEQSARPAELWRVTMRCESSRGDLRQGFPAMLAASLPYLGANSEQQMELEIYADDPAVRMLKGLPAAE